MLKSLFTRLVKGSDPTALWPRVSVSTPELHLRDPAVGSLRFGSPIDEAYVFGRPDQFARGKQHYCRLLYEAAGFQIDYDQDRLAYVAYFIAADEYLPSGNILFCKPKLSAEFQATSATTQHEIVAYLGEPSSIDNDSDETVLFYEHESLTLEFELATNGNLKRVNAYPNQK